MSSHALLSNSFRRTPNGLIFTDDLKTVYSVFLICLQLDEKNSSEPKSLFNSVFTKKYPYSFSIEYAVSKMKLLQLEAECNSTCINVSYSIKETLAKFLLTTFMEAHLLHTPADRTRMEPKEKVFLQPTPKGVAILTKYAKDIGLKKIPKILYSSLNSMSIFSFERSSITDSLIHSDKLLHVLLIRMIGEKPNVWSPNCKIDKLPSLYNLLEYNNDVFTFENGFDFAQPQKSAKTVTEEVLPWLDQIPDDILNDEKRQSPLYHKYFTNPNSDSHIQYYTSDMGLRLFFDKNSKIFKNFGVEYTFTSKTLWQWIMDCTDVAYPKEAISLCALFLKAGLLLPIIKKNPSPHITRFQISRSSYFTLSNSGWALIDWYHKIEEKDNTMMIKSDDDVDTTVFHDSLKHDQLSELSDSSFDIFMDFNDKHLSDSDLVSLNSNSKTIANNDDHMEYANLEQILSDPGLRYLFRQHLEKEFCAENLDVCIEIKKFLKRMTVLKRLIDSRRNKKDLSKKHSIVHTIDSALMKQANECLEMAFHIYSSYVMKGAPYQLNINHGLRENITSIILHPTSPIKSTIVCPPSTKKSKNNKIVSPLSKISILNQLSENGIKKPPQAYLAKNTSLTSKKFSRENKPLQLDIQLNKNDKSEYDNFEAHKNSKNHKPFLSRTTLDKLTPDNSHETIVQSLKILKNLYPLFEEVGVYMYKLMQSDSVTKFHQSKEYLETLSLSGMDEAAL